MTQTMRDVHGKFVAVHETEQGRHEHAHKSARKHYDEPQPATDPANPKEST